MEVKVKPRVLLGTQDLLTWKVVMAVAQSDSSPCQLPPQKRRKRKKIECKKTKQMRKQNKCETN